MLQLPIVGTQILNLDKVFAPYSQLQCLSQAFKNACPKQQFQNLAKY